jgi:hypothetical protein
MSLVSNNIWGNADLFRNRPDCMQGIIRERQHRLTSTLPVLSGIGHGRAAAGDHISISDRHEIGIAKFVLQL